MKKNIFLQLVAVFFLLSCQISAGNNFSQKTIDEKVKKMSKCEQVQALIQSHKNGFEIIRKQKSSVKMADIWTSKYHLIGKDCQIFGWSGNKYSYSCSIISPSEPVALERYAKAKSEIQSCLGSDWTLEERTRHGDKGFVAIYSTKKHGTAVATHAFETNGLFNDEWTNYVYVGDPKRMNP